jgi:hypothetical protein
MSKKSSIALELLGHVANTFVGSKLWRERRQWRPKATCIIKWDDAPYDGTGARDYYEYYSWCCFGVPAAFLVDELRSTTQNDKHYSTTITYAAETVSLFDEIILFVKGKVLYTGPIAW